jgi:hypothetical protein
MVRAGEGATTTRLQQSGPPRPAIVLTRALAGPLLIVVSVLVALHGFALQGSVSTQNLDLIAYFFPNHCFLGRSLAAGHVPAWNPYAMGGVPFAADPQSGWGYLPAMALYAVFPCDVALRWFVVLQPILGGLGVYWFLRSERASRAAACCGGVVLAQAMINSRMILSAPFVGAVAWTALLLAAASRYFRSGGLPGHLAWGVAAAAAWGQLASAHMSHGLILGTLALVAYMAARFWTQAREGTLSPRRAILLVGLLVVALPSVNLFILLPRLVYLPHTSISVGYRRLDELSRSLAGLSPRRFRIGNARGVRWALRLGQPPGEYLGAGLFLVVLGALWSRRYRPLAIAMAAFGLVAYLATLRPVARLVAPVARQTNIGTFYLHGPARFRHGVLLAGAVLIGLGVQAWQERRSMASRLWMVGASLALWGLLPLAFGERLHDPLTLVLAVAVTGGGLALALRNPSLTALVTVIIAVELTVNSVAHPISRLTPAVFVRGGPIESTLQSLDGGRLMTMGEDEVARRTEAALRSIVFGVEEAQGYNPVQLKRYWTFVRTVNDRRIQHNSAILVDPPPYVLDLLQVAWVVAPAETPPQPGWVPLVRQVHWVLYRLPDPAPRASVVGAWTVASAEQELELLGAPGFDPRAEVVVEEDPGVPSNHVASTRGQATYRSLGPQAATVDVVAPGPALVVIRNVYDRNWHAAVDGRPVPLRRADYLLQAVTVSAGHHVVLLTYDDPWVGYGLAGSALIVVVLLGSAALLARKERRRDEGRTARSPERIAPVPGDADGIDEPGASGEAHHLVDLDPFAGGDDP